MLRRIVYPVIGSFAVGLALLGIWLPILPTTPFLLIALWAFGSSNERFRIFVLRFPILREALREAERYQHERTISKGAKVIAMSSAWGSTVILALVTQNLWVIGAMVLAAAAATIFVTVTRTATSIGKTVPANLPIH